MSEPEPNCARWMAKADNDLLNIENNLRAQNVPWDTVCFHAQQAAEKRLKAFLVYHGAQPRKTRDLVALLAECVRFDSSLETLEPECRKITYYAIASRYPADLTEPGEAEARELVTIAYRIKTEIASRLLMNR